MKKTIGVPLAIVLSIILVLGYSIPPNVAQKMITLAEEAREQLIIRIQLINESTVNATILEQVNQSLVQGDLLLEQAKSAYSAGNYTEAAKLALEAMKTYRQAICLLCDYIENASLKIRERIQQQNATKCPGLLVAIERHLAVIEHLRDVLAHLATKGFNVTEAYQVLSQAENLLLQAKELALSGGNCSEVAKLDAQAMSLIGKAMSCVKKDVAEQAREKRVEKVLEALSRKLQAMKKKQFNSTEVKKLRKVLEQISNMTKKHKEKAKQMLKEVNKMAKGAKEKSKPGVGEKEKHAPSHSSRGNSEKKPWCSGGKKP